MKFGLFMAPFHRAGEQPTLALHRDLDLIEHLDALGFDEVWVGEHHSGARELIADPAMFIAAAAQRTQHIRLGTGVTSLPYHHPFMVADKMTLLDHLTRGRAMLGVGPGVLASDAYMLGIEPTEQRRMMNESLDAVMALLRGETVNMETDWFTLRDAKLQLPPYSIPHLPVAVATSFTPSGPGAAGRHGLGLLSVAGADHEAFERTWGWMEEAAATHGRQVSRSEWRVVLTIHLAESREQAIADIERGFARRAYIGDGPDPGRGLAFGPTGATIQEALEKSPGLIVGTPDDAVEAFQTIVERSGGIGGIMAIHHEWANTEATRRSYELWAREVAPHFQGQAAHMEDRRAWFDATMGTTFAASGEATARAFRDAGKEVPPEVVERLRLAAERRAARAREAAGGNPS
jgi:limonene 1,2-monooxygenase